MENLDIDTLFCLTVTELKTTGDRENSSVCVTSTHDMKKAECGGSEVTH